MFDNYTHRQSKPNISLRKQGSSFDLCSPEQFKTVDIHTIEDNNHHKFEVTVNVPVKPFEPSKKSLNQGKPPKPKGDKEHCHKRDLTSLDT